MKKDQIQPEKNKKKIEKGKEVKKGG